MHFPFLFILILFCGTTAQGAIVKLYYHPWEEDHPAAVVDADHAFLQSVRPAPNEADRARGWWVLERYGKYRGYVDISQIGKDLKPKIGAPIYQKPDTQSKVLTTVAEQDNAQVLWTGEFWEIEFDKSLLLYCKPPLPERTLSAPADPPSPPAQVQAELTALPTPAPSPATNSNSLSTPFVAPPQRPSGFSAPTRPGSPGVTQGGVTAKSLSLDFQGTLRTAEKINLLMDPPFPYELVDQNGQAIAYLDFSEMLHSAPIDSFLNKPVIVHGRKSSRLARHRLVILVQSIRQR